MRLLLVIILFVILAIGGLAGYAYLGDMTADQQEMRVPVELDLSAETPEALTPIISDPAAESGSEDQQPQLPPEAANGQGID